MGERHGGFVALLRGRTARSRAVASTIVLATLAAGIATPVQADDDALSFADARLRACAETALNVEPGTPITATDMAGLTAFTCDNYQYTEDYSPLQYATGLESLHLTYGPWDLAQYLPAMTHLQDLAFSSLASQQVVDALSSLTELRSLEIPGGVSDLSPLSGLTSLEHLSLFANHQVTSLDPIASLTELRALDLDQSAVASLDPVAGLQHLEFLDIASTEIKDFTALTSYPSLSTLIATCWPEVDPSPVGQVTTLEVLYLQGCGIDDARFFSELTQLRELHVDRNSLFDLRPLAALPHLTTLTATRQLATAAPVNVCVPHVLDLPYDVDGSQVTRSAIFSYSGADEGGVVTWIQPGADNDLKFTNASGTYSGTLRSPTNAGGPAYANCAFSAAPTVTISGGNTVGSTLTVSFDGAWNPAPAGWTEQLWMRDGIAGLDNGLSYVVQPADAGHVITFRLKGNRPGYEVRVSTSNAILIPLKFDSTWQPALSSAPTATDSTHVVLPAWLPDAGTATCSWTLAGVALNTEGACQVSLPATSGGKTLAGTVALTGTGYDSAIYQIPAATVLKTFGELDWVGRINDGVNYSTVDVGAKFTAKLPTYKGAAPTAFRYQWTRNGAAIAGATSSTYVATTADAGKNIGLDFTATRLGYAPSTSQAIDVFKVRPIFTTRPVPTVAGTSAVGYTLTAKAGTWSPAATLSYQWYRNGKAISGATKSTYKATTADGGQKLTVKVTAKKSGYTSASKTSASITVLKRFTVTATPTISGTAKVKYTLTAKTGTWGPGTVTKSYQWYRNGKAIAGATKSSYKLSAKDAYASITVKVTGKKSGYLSVAKTSSVKTPAGVKYSNCAALTKDYPGGVATSSSTIDKVRGVPADGILSTTYVSSKLYALNASRDADKDGWACEPN